jgi:hypothetical protein
MMRTRPCAHPPTRGYVPVCPDGASCLPACPVVASYELRAVPATCPESCFTTITWYHCSDEAVCISRGDSSLSPSLPDTPIMLLHDASSKGHVERVRGLVSNGVAIDARDEASTAFRRTGPDGPRTAHAQAPAPHMPKLPHRTCPAHYWPVLSFLRSRGRRSTCRAPTYAGG